MNAKKLAFTALFICFAAALSALESALPPIVPIAGVRVGLGNIVTLFLLYIGGDWRGRDVCTVAVLRCLVAALITGSPMNAAYGLAGGLCAYGAMWLAQRLFPKSSARPDTAFLPFVGAAGAIAHITGQLAVAVLFYGTLSVLAYAPILLISAIIGGVFTGLCTMLVLKKLDPRILNNIRYTRKDKNAMTNRRRHFHIGDEEIAARDIQRLIDPLWYAVNIYDTKERYDSDLAAFSLPQRYVFAIQWYLAEVYNGGHDQFFFNSTGIVWRDALDGMRVIGLTECADILSEAAQRMGGEPSFDREERWAIMDEKEPEFDDLDDRLYDIENIEDIMMEYINGHKADFYFDGEVELKI